MKCIRFHIGTLLLVIVHTTRALTYLDSKVRDRDIIIGGKVWDTWSSKPIQNNQSTASTSIAFSQQRKPVTSRKRFVYGDLTFAGKVVGTASGTTTNFIRIGHSLLALIVALVGGQLSRYLHAGNA